jgi:hypothetical protein
VQIIRTIVLFSGDIYNYFWCEIEPTIDFTPFNLKFSIKIVENIKDNSLIVTANTNKMDALKHKPKEKQ